LKQPLTILSLEDDSEFLDLVRGLLKQEGLTAQLHQTETRDEFVEALDRPDIDLILSDYQLPDFDGLSALSVAREKRPDIPFILLSGVLGEEFAVDALRHGATDYVLKQRLSRLVPTIRRAIDEAELRRERHVMEQRLRESEKLAATGRLAAAVAHEINNPLAGIKNSFRLVRDAIPPTHQFFEYVGLIENEIDRMARIVRQMFDLYHPQREAVRTVAVVDLCRQVVALLEPSRQGKDATIRIEAPNGELNLCLAENSLRQVLLNVVKNALEASPKNGQITVTVGASGHGARITVEDQGCGIPDAIKAHIFEPFYTTKTSGTEAGMGLGLAIAWGLVMALNGSIEFTSLEGQGTTFRMEIPEACETPRDGTK